MSLNTSFFVFIYNCDDAFRLFSGVQPERAIRYTHAAVKFACSRPYTVYTVFCTWALWHVFWNPNGSVFILKSFILRVQPAIRGRARRGRWFCLPSHNALATSFGLNLIHFEYGVLYMYVRIDSWQAIEYLHSTVELPHHSLSRAVA